MNPRMIVLPGASLLECWPVADGLKVRCPSCHAVRVFADAEDGPVGFVHADGCDVHRRILEAQRTYERTTVRRG